MKKILLFIIRLYQKTLSFDHGYIGKIFPNTRFCRFNPSCSEYMYDSVEKYGAFKGFIKGFIRFLKCNPISTPITGTYDPVK